jgi:hypothetical protein
VRVRRAEREAPVVRRYCETRYGARSWRCERRVGARIEATSQGLDIRYVVTNIAGGNAQWLYDSLYCACQCRLKSPQKCRLKIPHSITQPVCVEGCSLSSSRGMSVPSKALWKVNAL